MEYARIASTAFSELLTKHGFSQVGGEGGSFVRATDNGRCNQHVDVEFHTYMNAFSVVLQEVCCDLSRRRQLLGDFDGENFYRYDPCSIKSIKKVVERAVDHMSSYGFRWFNNEEIKTQRLEEKYNITSKVRYDRLIHSARSEFKLGNFENALKMFRTAAAIRELDEVSHRFYNIAKKRLD